MAQNTNSIPPMLGKVHSQKKTAKKSPPLSQARAVSYTIMSLNIMSVLVLIFYPKAPDISGWSGTQVADGNFVFLVRTVESYGCKHLRKSEKKGVRLQPLRLGENTGSPTRSYYRYRRVSGGVSRYGPVTKKRLHVSLYTRQTGRSPSK